MPAYVTNTEIRTYLTQVPAGAANNTLLDAIGARATAIIDRVLGFSFATYGAASSQDVRAPIAPSVDFRLPPYQAGSITSLSGLLFKGTTSESLTPITDWDEQDNFYLYRDLGWGGPQARTLDSLITYPWYRITAKWGYGPVPDEIIELALELSVNIWRSKDKGGFTEIVGVEGSGGVRMIAGLNAQQKMIVLSVRRKYVEVWH